MIIPLSKLEIFINLFDQKTIQRSTKFTKQLLNRLDSGNCKEFLNRDYIIDSNCFGYSIDVLPKKFIKPLFVLTNYIRSSKESFTVFYNIDAWFSAWIIKNNVYLYVPSKYDYTIPSYVDFPSWCKNFSYWDNNDPEKIPHKQWRHRGNTWLKLLDTNGLSSQKLTHVTIEAKEIANNNLIKLFPDYNESDLFSLQLVAHLAKPKYKNLI